LGSIFGLFLGSLYVAPWYSLVAFGAGDQVDASVAPNSAREYSVYTFSPLTAFIDTSRAGYFDSTTSIHGRNIVTRTCAAPLVASPMQTRAAFWAIAYGACCDTLTCDQWSNVSLVGHKSNITSAYRALAPGSTVWRDTVSMNQAVSVAAANAAAQAALHPNTSFPIHIDNEPRLFVTLNADPREFSSKIGISGLVPMGCVIAVWPFIIMLMAFPVELISMLKGFHDFSSLIEHAAYVTPSISVQKVRCLCSMCGFWFCSKSAWTRARRCGSCVVRRPKIGTESLVGECGLLGALSNRIKARIILHSIYC
jgi:hypothetical protein